MLAQASPWHLHALQRTSAELAEALAVPARMEWGTRLGQGPDANLLGPDLRGRHVLELGCGPGHNVAHVAVHRGATVTGVDLVGLQIRRARSHYGRLAGARFVAGHALHYLQATDETYDAIYSSSVPSVSLPPSSCSPPSSGSWLPGAPWRSPFPIRAAPAATPRRMTAPVKTSSLCPISPDSPSPAGSSIPSAGPDT